MKKTSFDKENISKLLLEDLKVINPYKAFIFGSYAYGKPQKDSDLDLLVVLNKDGYPKSFSEKMINYRKVINVLDNINKKTALDLIVYTKSEWKRFIRLKSLFSKEIISRGKEII
ncbi:MAG: nucleotidyltransferase domain-containing protein [Candidatus Margulisbacteria bacterium]|nr:nucleotidyltransferase domain-containing protein [Candidatus Margulisiibacteriota bacterium]